MAKEKIGFHAAENPDRTWQRQMNGRTYIFIKTREKGSVFLYRCKIGDVETSFYSDRDLMPAEVEQAPQFNHFISGKPQKKSASGPRRIGTEVLS